MHALLRPTCLPTSAEINCRSDEVSTIAHVFCMSSYTPENLFQSQDSVNTAMYCMPHPASSVSTESCLWYLQKEVTTVLLEGDKGGHHLEGVAMKGTIARRFEELDWDNNGEAFGTMR